MSLVNAVTNANLYILAPSLQQGFLDKDTGLPLAFGVVAFYRDLDRTALKPIFKVSGTPDDPVFVELQNPMTLSSIGTMFDDNSGQDIIPYYYPYDDEGNIDLYYITVFSAPKPGFPEGIEQFTREHYPSVSGNGSEFINQLTTFIPNGQFLDHQNVGSTGAITQNETPIAFGGWSFYTDNYSTSNNFVTFERYNAPIDSPISDPRYACRVVCTVANPADSRKDLMLTITDVNFLQGLPGTNQFTASSNDGNTHNVQLILRKNFGAGGSPTTEFILDTLTITPEIQDFLVNYEVPSNDGLILGSGNDDTFQLIVRSPLSTTSDISYTNAIGVPGTFALLAFAPVTPEQSTTFALGASYDIPDYGGADIGKSLTLGYSNKNPNQFAITYTDVPPTGSHLAFIGSIAPNGYLGEDGSSYAVQAGGNITSYPDLFAEILTSSVPGTYSFGTGINGFTNSSVSSSQLNIYWNRFDVAQPAPDPGTSGFTFSLAQSLIVNTQQQVYTQTLLAGSAITPGSYYRLLVNTTGPQFVQLFWMTVDGVGTQPVVTFDVSVQIDILSTDSIATVTGKIQKYANGLFQVPDLRNCVIQYWNNNSGNWGSSGAANRYNSINQTLHTGSSLYVPPICYITGNAGDNIGSSMGLNNPAGGGGNVFSSNWYPSNAGLALYQVSNKFFNGIIKT